jgi:transposase InsO family protein
LYALAAQLTESLLILMGPGGVRTLVAENLLLKQQLLILRRPRGRAPNLTPPQRLLAGASLWSVDLFCCESILLRTHWVMVVMDQLSPCIVGYAVQVIAVDGTAACRMFNAAIVGAGIPRRISTDNAPLFRFNRWLANLRILGVDYLRSVPGVPASHPFIERLIGTIRREFLDHTLFWNEHDLARKLGAFTEYYNRDRAHAGLHGRTPAEAAGAPAPIRADLPNYTWKSLCDGLFQLPTAA